MQIFFLSLYLIFSLFNIVITISKIFNFPEVQLNFFIYGPGYFPLYL